MSQTATSPPRRPALAALMLALAAMKDRADDRR
jgi:MYXO-CTERM domain-containing protein